MSATFHEKLWLLDEVLVYPAHGAGSLCGKNLSTDTVSAIAPGRRHGPGAGRGQLRRDGHGGAAKAPGYFSMAVLNKKERPLLEATTRSMNR